jgi:vancomycin permeability regulator SanA
MWWLKWMAVGLGLLGLAGGGLLAARVYVEQRAARFIYPANRVPPAPVAIVFGAGVRRDGSPTAVLYDRVVMAVELYHASKVQTLLMSGDGTTNVETDAMAQTAQALGAPPQAIVTDPQGLDTFSTCARAQTQYHVQSAILVTQAFHLPRAIYICQGLGIQATGVSADLRVYGERSTRWWALRELFATAADILEVFLKA